jgi:hypothetical protein
MVKKSLPHLPISPHFFMLHVSYRGDFVKNARLKVKIEDRIISLLHPYCA